MVMLYICFYVCLRGFLFRQFVDLLAHCLPTLSLNSNYLHYYKLLTTHTHTRHRIVSRAGLHLNRIIFPPYSFAQIQTILEDRLRDLQLEVFGDFERKFISRKIAGVAGDLRAALKICQHIIEMFRDDRNKKEAVAALAADKINPLAKFNVVSKSNTSKNSSSSGGGGGASKALVAEGEAAAETKELVKGFIVAAVDSYKSSSFIGPVSALSSLEKLIVLLMVKV